MNAVLKSMTQQYQLTCKQTEILHVCQLMLNQRDTVSYLLTPQWDQHVHVSSLAAQQTKT